MFSSYTQKTVRSAASEIRKMFILILCALLAYANADFGKVMSLCSDTNNCIYTMAPHTTNRRNSFGNIDDLNPTGKADFGKVMSLCSDTNNCIYTMAPHTTNRRNSFENIDDLKPTGKADFGKVMSPCSDTNNCIYTMGEKFQQKHDEQRLHSGDELQQRHDEQRREEAQRRDEKRLHSGDELQQRHAEQQPPHSTNRRNSFGNIDDLNPTGMAGKDGVKRSNEAAAHDEAALKQYKSCIDAAADKHGVPASVVAAIVSRETRGGTLIKKTGGYGDGNRGYGLMQCDTKTSKLDCTSCAWDSCRHIDMMTKHLVKRIEEVKDKGLGWSHSQYLQGGVAAYNFGAGNVRTWEHLDVGTAHNDYSNDVIARAKWFKSRGWD